MYLWMYLLQNMAREYPIPWWDDPTLADCVLAMDDAFESGGTDTT